MVGVGIPHHQAFVQIKNAQKEQILKGGKIP
jgi:hypothetical protein